MELKLKKEMMTTEATLRTNAQRVIQVTQALYQVEELLIFPKVMSFQNIPALGLPEKGHDQDW